MEANNKTNNDPNFYRVIVVGGGFAGVGAAIKLKEAGMVVVVFLE